MKIAISALLISLSGAPAMASCEYLVDGLQGQMESYRSFRDGNRLMQSQVLEHRTSCSKRGTEISVRAASLAAGASCQALREAGTLNRDASAVGEECEDTFRELHSLQQQLSTTFQAVRSDLEGALDVVAKDRLLKRYCADEIKTARMMLEVFFRLEGEIATLKLEASRGESEYAGVKAIGRSLASRAGDRQEACGSLGATPVLQAGVPAAGSAHRAGRAPASSSDITGTDRALQADAAGAEVTQ